MDAIKEKLTIGIDALNLDFNAEQIDRCLQFIQLLTKWNKTFNLTAIRQPLEMVEKHLLDSFSIARYIKGDHILDVGSGAGLPGIPLAIFFPKKHFTLLDSNSKKIRFIRQVTIELEMKNIEPISQRIEQLPNNRKFTNITTRAFAPLSDMLVIKPDLLQENGQILAMKGDLSEQEKSDPPKGYKIKNIHKLQVPGMDAERNLVILIPDC